MKKIKLLVCGDGGVFTGFAKVLQSIINNLPPEKYDVHHIAINYRGDPWPTKEWHKLYPAMLGGDLIGIGRFIPMLESLNPDVIFILNDLWLVREFIQRMTTKQRNKTVVYFPVDAEKSDPTWIEDFEEIGKLISYTEFGKSEILKLNSNLDIDIIPHGIDNKEYYPIPKAKAISLLNGLDPDNFIVLNANRNQPRKRLDLTFRTFKEFSKDKPKNVKLYLHCGIEDEGWHLERMALRYDIDDRLILTNRNISPVNGVLTERMNVIFNACDVGINTGMGEGWGLPNMEHGSIGKVQVVPNSSACKEIYSDIGKLIDVEDTPYTYPKTLTEGKVIKVESAVKCLNDLYYNESLREELNEKSYQYFSNPKFQWKNIANQWSNIFESLCK